MKTTALSPSGALWVAGAVFALALVGCSGPEALETEAVEGVVTLNGQAVPGAVVTFVPVQDGAGTPATGITDSEGKYQLTAVGAAKQGSPGAGTLPGDYHVGVIKDEFPEEASEGEDPDTIEASFDKRPMDNVATHVVPQKFNNPQQSGIKVTVQAGKNDIPIDLKSK